MRRQRLRDVGAASSGEDVSGETSNQTSRRGRLVSRVGWGIADQGISSLANFALGVVVARELGASGFGAFSLAFVTFSLVISAARGPSTDPLMVRHSGPVSDTWRSAVAASSGTAVALGVVSGLMCILVGLTLSPTVGAPFIALGVGLPGVLLQDSYRFAFFSCGQARRAFNNDLAWGIAQVLGVFGLAATGQLTPFSGMFVFGLTGAFAAGLAWWQIGIGPDVLRVGSWLVEHRSLGGRYLFENLSLGGARLLRVPAVGLVAGLEAVGSIRGAEMLLGPLAILLAGVSQVAVPEVRQVLGVSGHSMVRFCGWLAASQAVVVGLSGVAALIVLSFGIGHFLLGALWPSTQPLLMPTLVGVLLLSVQNSWAAGLRALGASRRSLAAQLTSAMLVLMLGVGGAYVGGALGSCWGLTLAILLGLAGWAYQLRRAVEDDQTIRGVVHARA